MGFYMIDYQQARSAMVASQIHTHGVVDQRILEAFETVPREMFAPEPLRSCAYLDEDLPIGEGRYLTEPQVLARLLQALSLGGEDVVLDIAGATGYSGAILAHLASTVIMTDSSAAFVGAAQENWKILDIHNAVAFERPFREGCREHAPYSAILINGAVAQVPDGILEQLQIGGRLAAVIRGQGSGAGKATLFLKSGEGVVSHRPLFDAFIPDAPGMERRQAFRF